MSYTFDGPNKLIILNAGTTYVSIREMYSSWKEWVVAGNAQFLPAISYIGSDPVPGGTLGTTYFLENGWKIRPQEANHTLTVVGNLYSRDGSDAFVNTIGTWNVRIVSVISTLVETVSTSGSGISAAAIAQAVRTELTPELTHVMTLANNPGLTENQATMLLEIYRLYGLDPTKPLVVTDSIRSAGVDIRQNIVSDTHGTTITRAA